MRQAGSKTMNLNAWAQWFRGKRRGESARRKGPTRQRPQLTVERLEDRTLMAMADLVAFRPVTPYINYANYPVAASVESDPKLGPGIRINGDDDNANGNPDYSDAGPTAVADNDLVRVDVAGSGTSLNVSWTGPLAVYTSATKTAQLAFGAAVSAGQQLWVEYASQTHTIGTSAELTLTAIEDATAAVDSVVFHSFQSLVVAIGGNSQNPANFGDSRLGIFTVGGTLYQRGYDVQLFSHDKVNSLGQGAALNEVACGVLNRNVNYVAILGYSWGAGATYELAAGLKADARLTGQYELKYTAYVDGIRHYTLSAERRLPALTRYHDNIYQRRDWLLRGDSVTGAANLNVTNTTWGRLLVHTTIDDNSIVQQTLVNNLTTRVVA
jgi:hypothetical protein